MQQHAIIPAGVSRFTDSINQRDTSGAIEAMMSYNNGNSLRKQQEFPLDPRRASMKDDYKSYVNEVQSAMKQRKTRVELEREKQMNARHEVGLADQIYNSRTHQDHQ